jgi:predicted metalloprotease
MRWKGRRQSDNIEDRRGSGGLVAGGLGTLVVAVIVLLLGGDPSALLGGAGGPSTGEPPDPEAKEFVAVVLADTEEVWREQFKKLGRTYEEPRLVLFTGMVESACGTASSAIGPFYCSSDSTIYIDLGFYEDLKTRFGAPGDFAQAYVIAHEVGHHVQNLLGVAGRVHEQRRRLSESEANRLSVKMELQADFYAGVWAHHARRMASLDEQDLEEAMRAAEAIGDDAIQKKAQGHVVPDSFTHGTSEQRRRWFLQGWRTGDPKGGDTFTASRL